jgi:hypothetical protein
MKLLIVMLAAATMSGCRFWYKPVPVADAIGEDKAVVAGDTLNVHRERRFEVYGPNPEAVYDGYEQLNRAYRAFERHFGSPVPRLALILAADTTAPLDSNTVRAFRDRGFTIVRYMKPPNFRSPSRYGALGYGGVLWPIAPTATRVLLTRFAESQLEIDDAIADTALLDRFPMWFRAAVIHLVGEAGAASNDVELVREKRHLLLPMSELLRLVRPASADSLLDPSRRHEADDLTRMLAAQSSTIARYLVEREGHAVVGRLARGYLAGRLLTDMTAEFKSAPRSLQELERRWKLWIDSRDR